MISTITKAKMVFSVEYASQADVIIFFTDYSSKAGWKSKKKPSYFLAKN